MQGPRQLWHGFSGWHRNTPVAKKKPLETAFRTATWLSVEMGLYHRHECRRLCF
jgi:hypothetical protein